MRRPARHVLLVASARPNEEQLAADVAALQAAGATVHLVAEGELAADFAGVTATHSLQAAAAARGPAFRRAVRHTSAAKRPWLIAKNDPWVHQQTRNSAVVYALDKRAVRIGQKLAKAHPKVMSVSDVDAAIAALPLKRQRIRPTGEERAAAIIDAMPAGAVRALAATPFVKDRQRFQIGRRYALGLLREGHFAAAEKMASRVADRISSLRLRADLLGDIVSAELAAGWPSALARPAYAAELAVADHLWSHGEHADAAAAFVEASRTAFHRVLHFDGLSSPLAAAPAEYLVPMRDSAIAQALRRSRGRSAAAAPAPPERPTRVVIATHKNANFLTEIRELLDGHPAFELRFLEFAGDEHVTRFARDPALLVQQIVAPDAEVTGRFETLLRPHLEWADVFFVEWCTALAAIVSLIDPKDTRLIVRLHSYEVFTQWPHLIDFDRVDDLLFVSKHLRDLAVGAIPALQGPTPPRLPVLPNAVALQKYRRPKPDNARFTLGVIGWSQVAKDPLWAIELVRQLRAHDERYRLVLIGSRFDATVSQAARAYDRLLRESEADEGAITIVGHTDDVAAALTGVGVIVSSSVRESFHSGLVEGAASGAVPVVRNWPFFAGRPHNARTLFPGSWVVETVEEAAARVLAVTATDDVWRQAGAAAAELALDRWDWESVRTDYAQLFAAGSDY